MGSRIVTTNPVIHTTVKTNFADLIEKHTKGANVSGKVLAAGKQTQPDPTYGTFEYGSQIALFQPDRDLRDNGIPFNRRFYKYVA